MRNQFNIVECLTDGDTVLGVGQLEQLHKIRVPNNCEELILLKGNVLR